MELYCHTSQFHQQNAYIEFGCGVCHAARARKQHFRGIDVLISLYAMNSLTLSHSLSEWRMGINTSRTGVRMCLQT